MRYTDLIKQRRVALLITMALVFIGAFSLHSQLRAAPALTDGVEWADTSEGVAARSVQPASPLAASLRKGDSLRYLFRDGKYEAIQSLRMLQDLFNRARPGDQLRYVIERTGMSAPLDEVDVTLTPTAAPVVVRLYLAFVGLVFLGVGLLVLVTQRHTTLSKNFFAWFAACFIICFYGPGGSFTWFSNFTDFLFRAALALVAPLFFHFCARFPVHQWMASRSHRLIAFVLYLPAAELLLVEALVHFAPGLFGGALSGWRYWLDAVELLQFTLLSAISLMFLVRSYVQARASVLRQQLRWVITAVTLSLSALGVLYDGTVSQAVQYVAYATLLPAPLMLGYAIVRYRLADVDLSLRQSFIHLLATAAVATMYFVTLWGLGHLLWTGVAINWGVWLIAGIGMLVMALLLAPVRKRLQEWAGRWSYGERYALRKDVQGFGRALAQTMPLGQLLDLIARRVSLMLAVEQTAIFIAEPKAPGGFRLASAWKVLSDIDLPDNLEALLRACLSGRGFITARQLRRENLQPRLPDVAPSKQRRGRDQQEAARDVIGRLTDDRDALYYYVPCAAGGQLRAIIAVGRAASGALLTVEEIDLLRELSGFIAVAFHNSQLYEREVERAKALARQSQANQQRAAQLKQQADEMARLKEFSERIIDNALVGLLILDSGGRVLAWNAGMEKLFALTRAQALGRNVRQALDSHLIAALEKLIGESGWRLNDTRYLYKHTIHTPARRDLTVNLSLAPFKLAGEAGGTLLMIEDVSDLITVEHQLQQQDRLASLGLIAAGVGREIHTPLAAVSDSMQTLLQQIPAGDPRRQVVEAIRAQIRQAAAVLGDLLNAPGAAESAAQEVNAHRLLDETLAAVRQSFGEAGIEIHRNYASPEATVRARPARLRQVFATLLLTARDSMPGGGRLSMQTRTVDRSLVIDLRDNGVGIPLEEIARIHDPARAAVAAERGADVGLMLCYSVIQEHGGRMFVQSRPGEGTHFSIKLPLAAAQQPPAATQDQPSFFRKYAPPAANKRIV
ncbi:MAG TPA: ATP-binding protein [Blastocatellia bacterium]|nr:ATP-binding protein [Blastocatellia bacterium]